MSGRIVNWDRKKDLASIKVPTLTVGAKYDTMDPEHMKWMSTQFPNGQYLYCPNGSHLAMWDDQKVYMDGVFLSVDIDVVDPGMAPGTGTPEPGGMTSRELLEAVRRICLELPIVGVDIVEVAPAYDSSDITAILANRVVLEALSAIALKKSGGTYSPTRNVLDR